MTAGPPLRIVVVGAGIGGAAAAIALARTGAHVEVHEQAPGLSRVGAGLQLAPNATRALDALDLLDEVRRIACRPTAWRSLDAGDAGVTLELPLGDDIEREYGSPYLHVHRGDLHDVLLAELDDLHLDHRLVGLEQRPEGIRVTFAGGDTVTADVVIGADGVHSKLREILHGPARACFSGLVAYRGIAPAGRVGDVPLVSAKWWGTDRHLVHYWVSAGRELNFVAPVPEETWTEESWTAEGKVGNLLDAFAGFAEPARQVIRAASSLMRSALYDREPLAAWGEGAVTLLGDACHPMLPFMAQGAGMALEDAVVLGRCLEAVSSDDVAPALARYATARRERTSAVQGGSRANDFLRGTGSGLSAAEVYGYDAASVPLPA